MEMMSSCPACLTMVTHEDNLFEVQCTECGTKFNPFLPSDAEGGIALDPHAGGAEPTSMETVSAPNGDYTESNAVFQDIRDFGETLGQPPSPVETPTEAPPPRSAPPPRMENTQPGVVLGEDCLVTSGDSLQGYLVEAYLPPVSALSELSPGENPLGPAMSALWAQARAEGANAVLSVRWSLSPDGARVIASGTPVKCSKS